MGTLQTYIVPDKPRINALMPVVGAFIRKKLSKFVKHRF